MNRPKLKVLIPDAESNHTLNILHCLVPNTGIEVYALSSKPKAYFRHSRYCKKFISRSADLIETDLIARITNVIKKYEIDVLFPIDEQGIQLVSKFSDTFNKHCELPLLPKQETAQMVCDKWHFFEQLKNDDIPVPETELAEHQTKIAYPKIVKPRKGQNGNGVFLVENDAELSQKDFQENLYLAQDYIDGYDIDCSFLADNGKVLACTVQKPIGIRSLWNRFKPSREIELCHNEEVVNVIHKVVQKLEWSGVGHADLRFSKKDGRYYLIEINPRYWSSILASLAAGINFPLHALNHPAYLPTKKDFEEVYYLGIKSRIRQLLGKKLEGQRKEIPVFSSLTHMAKDPLPFLAFKFRF
ncbi:MAG: ATP-grasp domain-containing protein [Bacteroidota bacterium]